MASNRLPDQYKNSGLPKVSNSYLNTYFKNYSDKNLSSVTQYLFSLQFFGFQYNVFCVRVCMFCQMSQPPGLYEIAPVFLLHLVFL